MKNISARQAILLSVIAFVTVTALILAGVYYKSPEISTSAVPVSGQAAPAGSKDAQKTTLSEKEIKALPPLPRAGYQAGLPSCVGYLTAIHNSFLSKTPSRSMKLGMEEGALEITAEIQTKIQTIYMSLSATQNPAGECQVAYDLVSHWPATCTDVYKARFPEFKIKGHVMKKILLLEGPGEKAANQKLYLMSLGGHGCISVSKRLLYPIK